MMNILQITSLVKKKKCVIEVDDNNFYIHGDYYYLVNKEFRSVKRTKDSCPVKEYLGLGTLRKRSPKKIFVFVIFASIMAFAETLAGKLSDYLFWIDTEWTSYIVNGLVILCLIFGLFAFFSHKEVIEISFLTKRFCVDESLFEKADMDKLHQVLMKLR